ncbi:hypothetical protein B2J93_1602 [Marssonina coronariae]|uniref:Uncharacterized protein n=1 Tax=Diplocarpon coronariae TaxID=2795749 RepID=A0A218Z7T5_9HELO|nr:hypothetical protein B2J93_1602 [Marssonina coronariae]
MSQGGPQDKVWARTPPDDETETPGPSGGAAAWSVCGAPGATTRRRGADDTRSGQAGPRSYPKEEGVGRARDGCGRSRSTGRGRRVTWAWVCQRHPPPGLAVRRVPAYLPYLRTCVRAPVPRPAPGPHPVKRAGRKDARGGRGGDNVTGRKDLLAPAAGGHVCPSAAGDGIT